MRTTTSRLLALCLVGLPLSSGGQDGDGHASPSVLSGKALGSGTVLHGQVGWPGISATLLTSLSDRLDAGGKVSLLYGYEGITSMGGVPGLKMQGVFRLELFERRRVNLGLRFSPGMFVYVFGRASTVGMALPVDLALGIAATPRLMLSFGIDFPMFVVFGPYGGLAFPVLLGAGLEYAIDPALSLTFNLRAGPSVPMTGYDGPYWDSYWCYDRFGRRYRCGLYYQYFAPAAEVLVGLLFRF